MKGTKKGLTLTVESRRQTQGNLPKEIVMRLAQPTASRNGKCTRIGRGCGSKRGAVSPTIQASRIIESIRRRQCTGEDVTLADYQPSEAIWAALQTQLRSEEWAQLN
jgi:hypothetical protein